MLKKGKNKILKFLKFKCKVFRGDWLTSYETAVKERVVQGLGLNLYYKKIPEPKIGSIPANKNGCMHQNIFF